MEGAPLRPRRAPLRGAASRVVSACLALSAAPHPAQAQTADAPSGQTAVDLLLAVPTDLAVSSVYRNQASQVEALLDGDLHTAWNSRSGDLQGAWIEVRIPTTAHVTAIEMTAGFTARQGDTDLFEGNHRVARVRVLHDGVLVGEHGLDIASRALQSIPVDRDGGTLRLELVALHPGTRAAWREACVSELHVLGTDLAARPGTRLPRTAVGGLPPPRTAPLPPPAITVERAHQRRVAAIVRDWTALEQDAAVIHGSTSVDNPEEVQAGLRRRRRALLNEAARFVATVDEAEGDALRIAALRPRQVGWLAWSAVPILRDELAALHRGMSVVGDFLGTDAAHCRWARALGTIHLVRARRYTSTQQLMLGTSVTHSSDDDPAGADRLSRRLEPLDNVQQVLERLDAAWPGDLRTVQSLLRRLRVPQDAAAAQDVDGLRAQAVVVGARCGR